MSRLMACPFCGAEAPLVHDVLGVSEDSPLGEAEDVCYIECILCGARGRAFNILKSGDPSELARAAWNMRAGTD